MIISQDYWEKNAKEIINVSVALSWNKIGHRLVDTWTMYFVPMFGESVCRIIEDEGNDELLFHARKALCNLCFWQFFDEFSVRVTDQGFQRQESDTFKSLYKYQSDRLRANYKNAGFNALEQVIALLDSRFGDNEKYRQSPCCLKRKGCIVQGMSEVMDVFNIYESYVVYLALRPDLNIVESTVIPAMLGARLYDALAKALIDGTEKINDHATTEELRLKVGRIVVAKALLRYIERYGTVTDRGYFYPSYKAQAGGNIEVQPVDADMRQVTVNQLKDDLRAYTAMLDSFIEDYMPEYREGTPGNVLKRNNNGKKTFWA